MRTPPAATSIVADVVVPLLLRTLAHSHPLQFDACRSERAHRLHSHSAYPGVRVRKDLRVVSLDSCDTSDTFRLPDLALEQENRGRRSADLAGFWIEGRRK